MIVMTRFLLPYACSLAIWINIVKGASVSLSAVSLFLKCNMVYTTTTKLYWLGPFHLLYMGFVDSESAPLMKYIINFILLVMVM